MVKAALVSSAVMLFSFQATAAAPLIEIPPIEQSVPNQYPRAQSKERVSLSGQLATIPMGGAKVTLQSTNYGQVVLFSPFSVPAATQSQLERLQDKQTTVTVMGILITLCSAAELRQADTVGCRVLDLTQPITIKPW